MSVSSYQFIDPKTLAAIRDLQLIAKRVAEGVMLGMHHSPKPGAGLEFSQYRSYQPGDDPQHIDWKMFARSDRYYVRESEIESSIGVHFILDASASMLHQDDGLSKFDYARFLLASLGYLAFNQGDAIGLTAIDGTESHNLPLRHTTQHLHRFLHHLEKIRPSGKWPEWRSLEPRLGLNGRNRSMIIFVSDMHEVDGEIRESLAKLAAMRNEVMLFQIIAQNELEFSWRGVVDFEDLETGQAMQVNADEMRTSYKKNLTAHLQTLRKELHDLHIFYEALSTAKPLDGALREFLKRRSQL